MSYAALLREAQRRRAKDPETYLCDLFPEQRAFVEDPSPAKVALCSRRAGKSVGSISHMMLSAMRHPGVPMAFLALTQASAKRIIWEELRKFDERYGAGIALNESSLVATFPNRTPLYVTGADNTKMIDRFRGAPYSTVVIDESASFRPSLLETLVEDVLEPALMDVQGSVVVMGTPGAVPAGFFHEISTGEKSGWSRHHWTLLDNTYLPHARDFIAGLLVKKKWRDDHPTYRREWLGQWVRDLEALVYPYDAQRNYVDRLPPSLPESGWHYILGIDFGVTNATAIVVTAWHEQDPTVYIVESEQRTGVIPTEAAAWVRELQSRYDFDRIVGDVGGLGKAFAEEMRRRHAIPVHAAQKSDKRGAQELMAGDMKSGVVQVVARPTRSSSRSGESSNGMTTRPKRTSDLPITFRTLAFTHGERRRAGQRKLLHRRKTKSGVFPLRTSALRLLSRGSASHENGPMHPSAKKTTSEWL